MGIETVLDGLESTRRRERAACAELVRGMEPSGPNGLGPICAAYETLHRAQREIPNEFVLGWNLALRAAADAIEARGKE